MNVFGSKFIYYFIITFLYNNYWLNNSKESKAELIFEQLNPKTASAYCSLIKGMARVKQLNNNIFIFNFI